MSRLIIRKLDPTETYLISEIAQWYHGEWETPVERTVQRLTTQPNEDVLFQLIALENDRLVATVGLSHEVNILNAHPHLRELGPWVALLFTELEERGKGIGAKLLQAVEVEAQALSIPVLYLYTFTAQRLYECNGWQEIERLPYKGHDTVVMRKELA